MRTQRLVLVWTAATVLVAAMLVAQIDVAGDWRVSFWTPSGPMDLTMYVSQTGSKLTGRLTSEVGEFPLTGNLDGDQINITWQFPDVDRVVDITFAGKVNGDRMTGTARLDKAGEGPFSAERAGR